MPHSAQPGEQHPTDLEIFEKTAIDALVRLRGHVESCERGDQPASGFAPIRDILAELDIERWLRTGGMGRESFDTFLQGYLRHSVKLHHPGYIAHQVSVPDYPAALGALLNGVTNNPMAIFEMGPAAATIEFAIINWMLAQIGYRPQPLPGDRSDKHGGGVLTHGGSLANLTALLAARARIAPQAWEEGTPNDLAVLVAPTSHFSIERAVAMLGLGAKAIYHLDVNEFGVIVPDRLEAALARVRADGRRCMALVANACATATGLHDPLRMIGDFCLGNDIWLHADACHGASALLSEHERHYLDGIELADSVVWDTHKMLRVPVLCAAVLLKDAGDLEHAFHQEASYLAFDQSRETYNSIQRTVECTKAALGLKIFLNLAWRGENALGDYVHYCYEAARRFASIIAARPGFEVPYTPETNILCFRYGDDDDAMVEIRERLVRQQQFHISSAIVAGRRHLRLTVMNTSTDAKTIEALLDAIEASG